MMHKANKLLLLVLVVIAAPIVLAQTFDLPRLPEPWQFGDVMITRQIESGSLPPVVFSHWSHRTRYTCRVCHFELGFVTKANETMITEEANKAGEFCGFCHNGETAFDHSEKNCQKCHTGGWPGAKERFSRLKKFPKTEFGNRIDWAEALELGLIDPKQSVFDENYEPMPYEDELDIDANWSLIPPARFLHDEHMDWLDCGDCHPGLFNVKKKTTENFEMRYILEGKFCGACHLNVAFPLNDCKRCHPKMRGRGPTR